MGTYLSGVLSEMSLENLSYRGLLAYFASVLYKLPQKLHQKADISARAVLKRVVVVSKLFVRERHKLLLNSLRTTRLP